MKLEEMKPRQVFYEVLGDNIKKYEFLCEFPQNVPPEDKLRRYYIVINKTSEQPERMYGQSLQIILDKNLTTYDQAKALVKKYLEDRLKRFDDDY